MERRRYRITIDGRLSERFAPAFEGATLETGVGQTTLVAELDQSQLHGLLDRVRDFGLELLRVEEASR
jgi:hypothetical protein